jgi:hypothetical protein
MKNKHLLFPALLIVLVLTNCKKEASPATSAVKMAISPAATATLFSIPFESEWHQTKLRCYALDINGNVVSDTTYSSSAFTNNDYLQTFTDSTLTISADYAFNGFGKGYPITSASVYKENYNYSAAGPFEYQLINPQPALSAKNIYTQSITTPDSNTLLVHSVYISGDGAPTPLNFPYYRTISDAYYAKFLVAD